MKARMGELGDLFGWNYKVVERSGATIASKLAKSNLWANTRCGRPSCLPCIVSNKPVNCARRNLVYETFCKVCNELVGTNTFVYVGETARSICERYRDHHKDYKDNLEKSHMAKHVGLAHGSDNTKPEFDIKIIKF